MGKTIFTGKWLNTQHRTEFAKLLERYSNSTFMSTKDKIKLRAMVDTFSRRVGNKDFEKVSTVKLMKALSRLKSLRGKTPISNIKRVKGLSSAIDKVEGKIIDINHVKAAIAHDTDLFKQLYMAMKDINKRNAVHEYDKRAVERLTSLIQQGATPKIKA